MTIDKSNSDTHFQEKRLKSRRDNINRRASVRFGDVMGRRNGKDRRIGLHIKQG